MKDDDAMGERQAVVLPPVEAERARALHALDLAQSVWQSLAIAAGGVAWIVLTSAGGSRTALYGALALLTFVPAALIYLPLLAPTYAVRLAELLASPALALAIGAPWHRFDHDPTLAAVAATLCGAEAGLATGAAPPMERWWLGPALSSVPAGLLCLGAQVSHGPRRAELPLIVVAAAVLVAVGLRQARTATRGLVSNAVEAGAAAAASAAAAELHSRIKNRARATLGALNLNGDEAKPLGISKTRDLILEIEILRRRLLGTAPGGATFTEILIDVCDDILPAGIGPEAVDVQDGSYDGPLAPHDAELARMLLSDLLSNCVRADAATMSVGLLRDDGGDKYRLNVRDDCGRTWDPSWLGEGSLAVLAQQVALRGGSLMGGDAEDGCHTVSAVWTAHRPINTA